MKAIFLYKQFILNTVVVALATFFFIPLLFASDGYQGLIAPSAPPEEETTYEEPPGYYGVMTGKVDQSVPAQNFTPGPNYLAPRAPKTSDDIRRISMVHGANKRNQDFRPNPAAIAKAEERAEETYQILSKPSKRIKGMLLDEYIIKDTVDRLLVQVEDRFLTKEERRAKAREVYNTLYTFALGFQSRLSMPNKYLRSMGFPPTWIKETKQAANDSLWRLDRAFKELRKYQ